MKRDKDGKKIFTPFRTQRLDLKTGKAIETIDIDIASDMRIGQDLRKELRESMTRWMWYAQLKEHAHTAMKQERYRQHKIFEDVYDNLRMLNPKLSETQVKNKVHCSEEWRRQTEKYMRWRDRYRMLHELCIALKERNDNLRTLESSERRERDGHYE